MNTAAETQCAIETQSETAPALRVFDLFVTGWHVGWLEAKDESHAVAIAMEEYPGATRFMAFEREG